jgi:hypothetical protein
LLHLRHGSPEEKERPPFEAVTRGVVKDTADLEDLMDPAVNFRVYEITIGIDLIVVRSCKESINPITN